MDIDTKRIAQLTVSIEELAKACTDAESTVVFSLLKRIFVNRQDFQTACDIRDIQVECERLLNGHQKRESNLLTTEEEALRQMKANGVNLTESAQRRLDKYDRKPVTKKELDEGFKKFHDSLVREYKEMTGENWDRKTMGPK